MRTSATPVTVCSLGLTMRLTRSLICSGFMVSLEKASHITGKASASTLAMTGSSIACGRRLRTREVRSRTSAAAVSASFSRRNLTVICDCSARLMEVITSTASMPAIESSSGLVTWVSITSAEAPGYFTLTVTVGSSILGYSRTDRRSKLTAPTSRISSDMTTASTGRRMETSASCISASLAGVGAAEGGSRCRPGRRFVGRCRCRSRCRSRGGCGGRSGSAVAALAGARQIDHTHRRAIFLQTLVAGGHDGIVGLQTFGDLHLARLTHAGFDGHPLGHQGVGLVTRHHLDHKGFAALRHDGFLGHGKCLLAHAKHGVHAGEHARAQLTLAVVDAAADADRAAVGVDQRVHRLHQRNERLARQGVHTQLRFLTGLDLALETLGQAEVHQHRINVFDVDDVRAVLEVITHADLLETGHAVKRGHDFQ